MSSSESSGPTAGPTPPAAPVPSGTPPSRARWRVRRRHRLPLFLVVLACAGGLFYWWWISRFDVSTDNAYVVGNITPIASYVSGQVVALFVDDNMMVQPGDPIAQIDPVPFQIAADEALSDYRQAGMEAAAAAVTARYTTSDRKSLLEGARAKQDEAEQAVRAAGEEVQTHRELLEKDQEVLASLKKELPGLIALRNNAADYYTRFNNLASTGDITVQERDNREAAYRDAQAKLDSLGSKIAAAERQVQASRSLLRESEARLEESRNALANARAVVGRAHAEQLQPEVASHVATAQRDKQALAEARLRLARLNLSNTLVRAPIGGIISRRTIQLGQTVEANKPFLDIVPLDPANVWIVANLREEQMARVRVGQQATISVDAIPDRTFNGWVESVAGGTGSVFSLFPPDNATGNFVRVVQRLPVRVRFRPDEYEKRVRPGMSSHIVIDTERYVRRGNHEW
jgi:membrane fusion protein, multidrug efflux system